MKTIEKLVGSLHRQGHLSFNQSATLIAAVENLCEIFANDNNREAYTEAFTERYGTLMYEVLKDLNKEAIR